MAQVGDREARLYALPLVRGGRHRAAVVTAASLEPNDRTTDSVLVATVALALRSWPRWPG